MIGSELRKWQMGGRTALRSRTATPLGVGIGLAMLSAAWYFVGSGRAYNYDASVTVGRFVATPSLLDPFHRHEVYDNHVYFSFLDHLVYTVTGSRDEHVLRALPILAGAAAVGLVGYELARRFGLLAGTLGAALMATNAMWVRETGEARGYSLLVLGAVGATICLFRLLEAPSRPYTVLYVVFLGGALGTHIYAALVLVVHVAVVVARHAGLKGWVYRWSACAVVGVLPTLRVLDYMYRDARARPRVFSPAFPLHLASSVLGRTAGDVVSGTVHGSWASVALSGAVVLVGLAALWRSRTVRVAAAAIVVVLAAVWLARPSDLYPRFAIWLLPAVALCAAAAFAAHTGRRRHLIGALIVVSVVAEIIAVAPVQGRSDLENRAAARLIDAVHAEGQLPCALGLSSPSLVGYTRNYAVVQVADERSLASPGPLTVPFTPPGYPRRADLRQCEMVVALQIGSPDEAQTVSVMRRTFANETTLKGAFTTAQVFSRRPLPHT